ncbi:MAG: TetR/AcrR family transcriptional regulator [Cytophagales bacterium]|nr:MAG: TetR/AcrR family transcriptional regulator [Cytophagales bacterium]
MERKFLWIETGYALFANEGMQALKVERLAKKVGISKSSFYHYFADNELFIEELLDYHLQQSRIIAEKEKKSNHIDPDLIAILIEHKTDLLFNRQLRIQRNNPRFAHTLSLSDQIVGNSFIAIWVKDLGLQLSQKQLEGIFSLALENFYLQISEQNLSTIWLSNYFENLKTIVKSFE